MVPDRLKVWTDGHRQNYIHPTSSGDKKQLVRWYFLYLHLLTSENLGPLSVALILDINLFSSFVKCRSLRVNVFVFIHQKTLSMAEVYVGYLNAQTHTINSPAWWGLSQSYAF